MFSNHLHAKYLFRKTSKLIGNMLSVLYSFKFLLKTRSCASMKAMVVHLVVLGSDWVLNKTFPWCIFFSPHPFTLLCNRILRLWILKIIIFDPINPSPFSHTHVSTHSSKNFVYTHLWMLCLILKSTLKGENVLYGDEIIVLVFKKRYFKWKLFLIHSNNENSSHLGNLANLFHLLSLVFQSSIAIF